MSNFILKGWRADIDALRGISIILVILYHSKFYFNNNEIFSGGFIGVDIFFVITGYLITKILFIEFEKNNSINIINFYKRRIKRLIPTLLVVILFASIFSIFVLNPIKLVEFSKSVFASIFFLANMFFHYFGDFYGQDINLQKPLLHLWSLGVEEQFYFFYPVTLLIILKYFKRYLLFFLIFGFSLSLFFAEFASEYHRMFSFYMLPSRIWEILSGALIFYIESKKKKLLIKNININAFTYFICLICLLTSFFLFDINNIKHPSFITLIPILSVSLIILLGCDKKEHLIKKIISNKIFIFFGKISYSLYLWHFVFFSIFRNSPYEETNLIKFIIIIISIILSILSYYYIEKVHRNRIFNFKKTLNFILILIIINISINCFYLFNKKIFLNKYYVDGVFLDQWLDDDWVLEYIKTNKQNYFKDKSKLNVLIVGNCHADDTFIALKLNQNFFPNYEFVRYYSEIYNLDNLIAKRTEIYSDVDIILISTRWRDNDISILETLIKKIQEDGKKIVILSNIPEFYYDQ